MRRLILLVSASALLPASPAMAHGGHVHGIGWTLSPEVVLPLAVTLLLYGVGLARLLGRSRHARGLLVRRALLFLAGWLILAGALTSPLHEAGEVSFALHMVEHELIMLPAALLLVAARPGPVLLWGLPAGGRRMIGAVARVPLWRGLANPFVATLLQSAALVVWHMPALFDRAVTSEGWHVAQHLSFVATALLFWWAMLPQGQDQARRLTSAVCLFVTSMVGGGLGALMALGASPWYEAYVRMGMTPFGLTPAEDQQLAGLVMWVPGGLFHLGAALVFLGRALGSAPENLDDGVTRRRKTA
ncbi:MAG TPA: cytochrome c oxidase assembly protein [Sphingobium sp.]|nr:cytochrome c oxidase assembly protein [Sphingobium sp.]